MPRANSLKSSGFAMSPALVARRFRSHSPNAFRPCEAGPCRAPVRAPPDAGIPGSGEQPSAGSMSRHFATLANASRALPEAYQSRRRRDVTADLRGIHVKSTRFPSPCWVPTMRGGPSVRRLVINAEVRACDASGPGASSAMHIARASNCDCSTRSRKRSSDRHLCSTAHRSRSPRCSTGK